MADIEVETEDSYAAAVLRPDRRASYVSPLGSVCATKPGSSKSLGEGAAEARGTKPSRSGRPTIPNERTGITRRPRQAPEPRTPGSGV